MIIRNEARCLDRCLSSLDPAWELIVVDTGSTDETIQIADRYGAKVYHFEWIDDFSAARNFSLEKATREWIFVIDADEWLEPESVRNINALVKDQAHGAYEVSQVNPEESGQEFINVMFRLFRNHPSIHYVYPGHEQVAYSIKDFCEQRGYKQGYAKDVKIRHDGYVGVADQKTDRAMPLMEKGLQQYPESVYLLAKYSEFLLVKGRTKEEYVVLLKFVSLLKPGQPLTEMEMRCLRRFQFLYKAKSDATANH